MTASLSFPVVGGLDTKMPPISLRPDQSPDSLNMLVRDGAQRRRGGFQPKFRDQLRRNCLKNTAYRATGRVEFDSTAPDGEFLSSNGCLNAGHRPIYEQQTGFTFALWFSPGDLATQTGGNGTGTIEDHVGAATWKGAPYTIKVMPILSKGPIKRSDEITPVAATDWGTHANSGMPFCLYLFNNSGTWEFRLAAHVLVGGSWTLQTVTSGVAVVEDGLYHIIGVCSGERVALRVARYYADDIVSTTVYTENENAAFSGTLGYNKCPVQVFDCPQRFVQDTGTGSATQRPGLNLGGIADGGYWWACMRPDGKIQDVAIWAGDLTLSTLERHDELEFANQVGLINLWSMGSYGRDYVQEETGRGNHLYMVPRGPIEAPEGGKEGGSWWYNGQTSYASIDVDSPNWRGRDNGTVEAAMFDIVKNNRPHGMAVDVWPDSIEPGEEQVIAEVHGVMKLTITKDGKFAAYVRDGVANTVTAVGSYSSVEIGAEYQAAVIGTTVVECGERYHVAMTFEMNLATTAYVRLYVNRTLEAVFGAIRPATFPSGGTADAGSSNSPGGITLGFGSVERMIRGAQGVDSAMASPNATNTDHALGFVGRIETFMILTTPDGVALAAGYRPEDADDWRFSDAAAYLNPRVGDRTLICSSDFDPTGNSPMDALRNSGDGTLVRLASQHENTYEVLHAVKDTTSTFPYYTIETGTMQTDLSVPDQQGHEQLDACGGDAYHILCYYRFDSADGRVGAAGSYVSIEWRYDGGTTRTTNQERHPTKSMQTQTSSVYDATGFLGAVGRVCVESDQMADVDGVIFNTTSAVARRQQTHRFSPYERRSPFELGMQWSPGMIPSVDGANPVTMAADYEVQTDGRRITIAGSGRQLYWAKHAWDDGRLLWIGGQDSYCFCRTSDAGASLTGSTTKTTVVLSCWLRPYRLDGYRSIARKAATAVFPDASNWMVYTFDGAINVSGTEGGTNTWRFVEGQAAGATPGGLSVSASLKMGKWNHLQVEIGGATPTVTVRVNGRVVPMLDLNTLTGANQTDPFGTLASDDPTSDLYVGGMPPGRSRITFPNSTGSAFVLPFESWYGQIAEVKLWTSIDTSRWPTNQDGYVPKMETQDSTALYEWMMDEEDGYLLTNTGTTADATENGDVRIREFYEIANSVEQEKDRTFRHVAFRDRLILTNGADNPQVVTWNGLTDRDPLVVRRLGTEAPVNSAVYIKATVTVAGGATLLANGIYIVVMTYLTADGKESEPTLLAAYNFTAGTVDELTLQFANVPRSPDPQVVGARIYASATGGGPAIENRDWDGHSPELDVRIKPAAVGVTSLPGNRLAAPRARHVAVAGSALMLADLPEEPSGQNALAFSTPSEISYFTLASTALIDSEDGKALIGIAHNMGTVFLSKRNSVHQIGVGSIVNELIAQAQIRLVHSSDGIGGGTQNAGNLLYGAGDRGVFMFNNSEPVYLSESIERTWRDEVDATDLGLYVMHGAFYRPFGQYWISVRLKGQTAGKSTILAFDLTSSAWTRLLVPAHSVMGVLEGPNDQVPIVTIGTDDGRILVYNDTIDVDGASPEAISYGPVALTEQGALTGSAASLFDAAGRWPVGLGGFAGSSIEIVTNAGTFVRTISRNWLGEIQWTDPIPGWTTHLSYTIGGFESYWTSPWLSGTPRALDQKLKAVMAEFEPRAGTLEVSAATCAADLVPSREWPTAAAAVEVLPAIEMSPGYTERPRQPRSMSNGAYHRVRFRTNGVLKPWSLNSYGLDIDQGRSHAKTGRVS